MKSNCVLKLPMESGLAVTTCSLNFFVCHLFSAGSHCVQSLKRKVVDVFLQALHLQFRQSCKTDNHLDMFVCQAESMVNNASNTLCVCVSTEACISSCSWSAWIWGVTSSLKWWVAPACLSGVACITAAWVYLPALNAARCQMYRQSMQMRLLSLSLLDCT